jgi:hypothetical protein
MKLLYLWIEDFNNIKNQGFNFGSNHHFKYDTDTSELHLTKSDEIPEGFFGNDVNDIAALIGENGSGKSSVLEFIHHWLGNKHLAAIVVFEGEILVYGDEEKLNNETGLDWKISNYAAQYGSAVDERVLTNTAIIYYSIFFDNSRVWHPYYSIDVSTNFLLEQDLKEFKLSESSKNVSETYSHKMTDFRRHLDLFETDVKVPFNYPDRAGGYIHYNWNSKIWETHLKGTEIDFILNHFAADHSKNIFNRYESNVQAKSDFHYTIARFWIKAAVICYIIESKFNEAISDKIKSSDESSIRLGRFGNFRLKDVNSFLLNSLSPFNVEEELVSSVESLFIFIDQNFNEKSFFPKFRQTSLDFVPLQFLSQFMEFEIGIPVYKKFFDLYEKVVLGNGFLNFNTPGLSSGENSFVSLFARLNAIKNDKKLQGKDQVILLIDEGETAFHPDWHKKYVEYLIESVPEIFNGKKIQFILSSNSPYILSDIPRSNVNFLRSKTKQTSTPEISFGGNIVKMLMDNFFMSGGTVGEFARHKIDTVFKRLNDDDPLTKEEEKMYRQIIDLIDEPLISIKLNEMFANKVGQSGEEARLLKQQEIIRKRLSKLRGQDD